MGKNNRARRAAKQRRDHRKRSSSGPHVHAGQPPTVFELVWGAADAFGQNDPAYDALVEMLEHAAGAAAMVEQQLALVAHRLLDGAGWLPADLPRITGRKLTEAHVAPAARVAALVGGRLASAGSPTPRWSASLRVAADGAAPTPPVLRVGIELLSLLEYLPRLPEVEPPPGRAPARAAPTVVDAESSRYLDKIRALLAKAESTTFPEEAEALTAKAQELIARHSIDAALLHARTGGRDVPVAVRLWLDDPYAEAKAMLLHVIAGANRGQATWSTDLGFMTVFGFAHDLDAIELLYASLRVQAVTAMTRQGSVRDRTGTSRTRSFRRSFLQAFAHRIGQRLRIAADVGVDAARAEVGEAALLPVLRQRDDDVIAAQRAAFPEAAPRAARTVTYHPGGWAAGTTAANLANLGVGAAALTDPR